MIKLQFKLLLLLALLLPSVASAEVIDGINYFLSSSRHNAIVLSSQDEGGYVGYVKIPETVQDENGNQYTVVSIDSEAFSGCDNLTVIDLPKTIDSLSFLRKTNLNRHITLIIRGENISDNDFGCFDYFNENSTIYAPESILKRISSWVQEWKVNVMPVDVPYFLEVKQYIKRVDFKLLKNYTVSTDVPAEVKTKEGSILTPDANGIYSTSSAVDFSGDVAINGQNYKLRFKEPSFNVEYTATQTTITIKNITLETDDSFKYDMVGFYYRDKEYDWNGKDIKFTDLSPNYTFGINPYVYYQNGKKESFRNVYAHLQTNGIFLKLTAQILGPTCVKLIPDYNTGDLKVKEVKFSSDIVQPGGLICGLRGDGEVLKESVTVECEGGYKESASIEIKDRPALELTTLDPKCVSEKCAIVGASTNISPYETNAGFQWKKYDAPESLKPSEAFASVYDGMLEGYIKNLQSTSFYRVRAFYKDSQDNYYYGDWVTFDPSDFSYFEPTVHTYPVEEVAENSAVLRGYVLQGTDDIIRQGFQYWAVGTRASEALFAPSEGLMTAEGFGQVMQVVISDLEPGMQYGFRSFVETSKEIVYGEEQTFTTEGDASVGDVISGGDVAKPEIVGYYDLMGRRHATPQKGFNIVVYSDKTVKKVLF